MRKIIRNVDTKQKVYGLIPFRSFLFIVLPICTPLFLLNFIALIQNKIDIVLLILSTIIVSIVIFLCSELRFGETGFNLIYDLLFHSKVEHIENFNKGGKQ